MKEARLMKAIVRMVHLNLSIYWEEFKSHKHCLPDGWNQTAKYDGIYYAANGRSKWNNRKRKRPALSDWSWYKIGQKPVFDFTHMYLHQWETTAMHGMYIQPAENYMSNIVSEMLGKSRTNLRRGAHPDTIQIASKLCILPSRSSR